MGAKVTHNHWLVHVSVCPWDPRRRYQDFVPFITYFVLFITCFVLFIAYFVPFITYFVPFIAYLVPFATCFDLSMECFSPCIPYNYFALLNLFITSFVPFPARSVPSKAHSMIPRSTDDRCRYPRRIGRKIRRDHGNHPSDLEISERRENRSEFAGRIQIVASI